MMQINYDKFNAFVKMMTRAEALTVVAARSAKVGGTVVRLNWGCGFGPRSAFDYAKGASEIKLSSLPEVCPARLILLCD